MLFFQLALTAIVIGLIAFFLYKRIKLEWYEWVIGVLGFGLLAASIQHLVGSFEEGYPRAGLLGMAILGVLGLVFLAIAWQLRLRKKVVS